MDWLMSTARERKLLLLIILLAITAGSVVFYMVDGKNQQEELPLPKYGEIAGAEPSGSIAPNTREEQVGEKGTGVVAGTGRSEVKPEAFGGLSASGEFKPGSTDSGNGKPQTIVVDIKGAVKNPGVYQLPLNSRVHQAIDTAGGLLQKADTQHINLAQPLSDGAVIYIPAVWPVPAASMVEGQIGYFPELKPGVNRQNGEQANAVGNQQENKRININTASAEELQQINGIGPAKAQAIVEYRKQNGLFQTLQDLTKVPGIGEKTLQKMKEYLTVQ